MTNSVVRELPTNVEAEQIVLGGIFLEPSALFRVDLRGHEFRMEKHQQIFRAMLDLAAAGRDANFLNVSTLLSERKQLEGMGGAALLTSLLNGVATAVNIEQAADLVQHAFVQRSLIHKATEIAEMGYGGENLDTDELLTKAHNALTSLELSPKENGVTMAESAVAVLNEIEDLLANPRETYGIPTHLDIDRITNGLNKGDLIIKAADPGKGKTALLHQILLNIGMDGVRSYLYSFEMRHAKVTMRMACNLADVNSKMVRRGQLTEEEADKLRRAMGQVHELPIRVFDRPCTMQQIDMDLARAERAGTLPQVVGIDYTKLMLDKAESEVIKTGNITRMGKVLAMRYDISVIMIHVLTGDPGKESRMPELRDLGWSRQTQYDPDIVLFPFFKTDRTDSKAMVGVGKNREGEADGKGVTMNYVADRTRWTNYIDPGQVPQQRQRVTLAPAPTWDDTLMVEPREYA
jgi:replicative DNA helicase